MKCPKCGYLRTSADNAPAWQCPSCGIAYSKVTAPSTAGRGGAPVVNATAGGRFRKFRIILLLLILGLVALDGWLTTVRSTDWAESLWVVVYPINVGGDEQVADYIQTLDDHSFSAVQRYFAAQAERYGVTLRQPVEMRLGPELSQTPPLPPADGGVAAVMWWSLKLRYWSVVNDRYDGPRPDIKVFVLYHRPEQGKRLAHSTGLQKGMVSVVHAFADAELAGSNNVVIAHEMLHTLGATDKYDLASGRPIFPHGFAEPRREPLYPQHYAEIMGGYIPASETETEMPAALAETLVGAQTAGEIGWSVAR